MSKPLFIVPTDAHCYKIIEMLKQFKIITLVSTCFRSRRNHHQGAVLCSAKITNMVFCARRYRRSQCYGDICRHNIDCVYNNEHKKIIVLAEHRTAPWWWFLRERKHVGASVI